MTINKALIWTKNQLKNKKISISEAEILLKYALKKEMAFILAHPEYQLNQAQKEKFFHWTKRRIKGEPVAYIIGEKEFYGLKFFIERGVFIPRPETELLVEEVLKITKNYLKPLILADVGAGCGAIAITLAKYLSKVKIYALDISKKALEIAKKNAKYHQVDRRIVFIESNLLKNLPEKVDIIIANLPYLKNGIKPNLYEPEIAYNGGKNGLEIIKKLLHQTPNYLKKHGQIFLEIDPDQVEKIKKITQKIFPQASFQIKKDLSGFNRCLIIAL